MISKYTKNKKVLLALCISGVFCTSCSDFLEVQPPGQTTIPVLFSDMDGMRSAVIGAYGTMFDYYSSEFYMYPEIAGNMVSLKAGATIENMLHEYNFISNPDDETLATGYIWKKIFSALTNVNNILEYQPSLMETFPEYTTELTKIRAQALFLRALCHFDVCLVYAQPYSYTSDATHLGVPVLTVTPGADDNVGRSSVQEVYTQIVKDLNDSQKAFGNTQMTDAWHASKTASQALLCRVSLYMGDWDETIRMADSVLQVVPLAYGQNYLDMYNNNEAGDEAIFRLNGYHKSSWFYTNFYAASSIKAVPADTLYNLFDPQDLRLSLIGQDANGGRFSLKYRNNSSVSDLEKHYDPFVLRASEMYLNRAEAWLNKGELGNATADLKILIARNLKKEVSEIFLPESNVDSLQLILRQERAKELCFEGHQFFDIVRWKQDLIRSAASTSVVKFLAYPNDRFVLPIPQTELEANHNMVGNPTVNY